jgi:hypothetical protein
VTVTIVLPLPPTQLTGNGRANRWGKAKLTATYREAGHIAAVDAINRRGLRKTLPWRKVTAVETYYFRRAWRRDIRNFEAGTKAYYDGFRDAGLLADDDAAHLTHAPSRFAVDPRDPRLEITLTREDEA